MRTPTKRSAKKIGINESQLIRSNMISDPFFYYISEPGRRGCPGVGDGLKRFCPQADGEAEDADGFELVAEVDQVFVF